MATNVIQRTTPDIWSSNSDNIIYEFDFIENDINSVNNSSGKARVLLTFSFSVIPIVGEYIYINSNVYNGIYKILDVISDDIAVLDTPYISDVTSGYVMHLRSPVFELYKGHQIGEEFDTELPYTKVASLQPSYTIGEGAIPYIKINVKSICKNIFRVTPEFTSGAPDFSLFNAIRLIWDGEETEFLPTLKYTFVLNSGLNNNELQEKYSQYGYYLINTDKPVIANSGYTVATFFYFSASSNSFPVTFKITK